MYSYQKCNNLITEKNLPKIQNYLSKNMNNISSQELSSTESDDIKIDISQESNETI
jgi:hypothetical protein